MIYIVPPPMDSYPISTGVTTTLTAARQWVEEAAHFASLGHNRSWAENWHIGCRQLIDFHANNLWKRSGANGSP